MSLVLSEQQQNVFWSHVIKGKKCWYWEGVKNRQGYGIFPNFNNKGEVFAHRISFMLQVGNIPETKPELDHYCHTPNCVNPDHILPTTRSGNLRTRRSHTIRFNPEYNFSEQYFMNGKNDFILLQKRHCKKGHEIHYLKVDKTGKARCIDCLKDKDKIELRNPMTFECMNPDINKIKQMIEEAYGGQTVSSSLKQLLLQNGFDSYGKSYIQCREYLKRILQNNTLTLEDLAVVYGLKPTITKLRKKPEGVLLEP